MHSNQTLRYINRYRLSYANIFSERERERERYLMLSFIERDGSNIYLGRLGSYVFVIVFVNNNNDDNSSDDDDDVDMPLSLLILLLLFISLSLIVIFLCIKTIFLA